MGDGRAGVPFRGHCLLVSLLLSPAVWRREGGGRPRWRAVCVGMGGGAVGGGADTLLAYLEVCMLEGGIVLCCTICPV